MKSGERTVRLRWRRKPVFRGGEDLLKMVRTATSGKRMIADVRTILSTDKWNSFDQFAKTDRFMEQRYRSAGAEVETWRIPTGGALGSGRWIIQEALDIHAATLDIEAPVRRRIADYRENPFHVVQWTAATPKGGVSGPVVVVDGEEELRRMEPGALTGRIVLTRLSLWWNGALFERTGALGVVTDRQVNSRSTRPEHLAAVAWDKLGWSGQPLDQAASRVAAMVLSATQGAKLRALISRDPGKVRLRMAISATRYNGSHNLVTAVVRGSANPQDEIWCMAHTAEPGAQDNAAGMAICIETARVLENLIREGRIPRPLRSIRFLTGYESYSFFHYIEHRKQLQPPLAGINVDGIGAAPRFCNGVASWNVTVPQSAGFVNAFGEGLLRDALATGNPGYRVVRQRFVPTTDTLAGDPRYGFPCPWVNHSYLDKKRKPYGEYHSSGDDIRLLGRGQGLEIAVTMIAAYLHRLADMRSAGALSLAKSFTREIARRMKAITPANQPGMAEYLLEQHQTSMKRLALWIWDDDDPHGQSVRKALDGLGREILKCAPAARRRPARKGAAALVPFRTAPITPDPENMPPDARKLMEKSGLSTPTLFWANGERSLDTIALRLGCETGKPAAVARVEEFFRAMEMTGYVKMPAPDKIITHDRLEKDLRKLGVKRGMDLMVHSSLSRLGCVRGGENTVIDVLLDVIGPEGTLLMPSFNHGHALVYHPFATPTTNGAIPDAFWRRTGAIRSHHPTHPVAAKGPRAEEFVRGHLGAGIWGAESPVGRLVDGGGWILALGVTLQAATAYHVAEISAGAKCIAQFGCTDRVIDHHGIAGDVKGLAWRGGSCPVNPKLIEDDLARTGRLRTGTVGEGASFLAKAKDVWTVRRRRLLKVCPTCKIRPDPRWKDELFH